MEFHFTECRTQLLHATPNSVFHRAFGLGEDRTHIDTIDSEGVALAAIQGLYRQNKALQRENESLRSR